MQRALHFKKSSSILHLSAVLHSLTQFITDQLVLKNLHLPIILADIHSTIIFVIKIVISIFLIVSACVCRFATLLFLEFLYFCLDFQLTSYKYVTHKRTLFWLAD